MSLQQLEVQRTKQWFLSRLIFLRQKTKGSQKKRQEIAGYLMQQGLLMQKYEIFANLCYQKFKWNNETKSTHYEVKNDNQAQMISYSRSDYPNIFLQPQLEDNKYYRFTFELISLTGEIKIGVCQKLIKNFDKYITDKSSECLLITTSEMTTTKIKEQEKQNKQIKYLKNLPAGKNIIEVTIETKSRRIIYRINSQECCIYLTYTQNSAEKMKVVVGLNNLYDKIILKKWDAFNS